jgi:hypothetical protein
VQLATKVIGQASIVVVHTEEGTTHLTGTKFLLLDGMSRDGVMVFIFEGFLLSLDGLYLCHHSERLIDMPFRS